MNKRELIISLMRLDNFYNERIDELNSVLGPNSCVECFYPNGDIKSIEEIIFDITGIPEETAEESVSYVGTPEDAKKGFEEGYCRDAISEIYSEAANPLGEAKITIEKVTEILISVGENKGYFLPEYEKYLNL